MVNAWNDINKYEISENYPKAVAELEQHLSAHPDDVEAVIRLGFDYGLSVIERDRLHLKIVQEEYAKKFVDLFRSHEKSLGNNADFCFAFGLPLNLFHYYFASSPVEMPLMESLGKDLMRRAATLNPMFGRLQKGNASQEELSDHFSQRGCFARYYNVVEKKGQ